MPHQANKRIIEATAERMGLPMDRVMVTINKFGNTTAATIPLCLWDYEPRLKTGDRLIMAAFGGGFTWAGAYVTWAYGDVPILRGSVAPGERSETRASSSEWPSVPAFASLMPGSTLRALAKPAILSKDQSSGATGAGR